MTTVLFKNACQRCQSDQLISVGAKHSDAFGATSVNSSDLHHDGYGLDGVPWGSGDYIEFVICVSCGQMQGQWGLTVKEIARQNHFGADGVEI